MRKITTPFMFLLFLFGLSFFSCSEREIDYSQIQERDSLYYEINSQKPYTGGVYSLYESGQNRLTGFFKKGKRHKEWLSYHVNGELYLKQNYVNGVLNGKYEEYEFPGSYIKGTFKDGEKEGLWVEMYPDFDDEPGSYTEIEYKDGKRNGKLSSFTTNKVLKSETFYKDDKRHGSSKEYYENGNIESEREWKNGKLHGQWTSYHENGNVRSNYTYTEDSKRSEKKYGDNGQLLVDIEYPGSGVWFKESKPNEKLGEGTFDEKQKINIESLKYYFDKDFDINTLQNYVWTSVGGGKNQTRNGYFLRKTDRERLFQSDWEYWERDRNEFVIMPRYGDLVYKVSGTHPYLKIDIGNNSRHIKMYTITNWDGKYLTVTMNGNSEEVWLGVPKKDSPFTGSK